MDSINRSDVNPSKSRLARTFAKVLHIRAVTGSGNRKPKSQDKFKNETAKNHISKNNDVLKKTQFKSIINEDENRASFLAKLFANISAIKAAYALLQFAQSPYDPDFILSTDDIILFELKNLSELKQCYLKNQFDDCSSETTRILAEIKELKSVVTTYEIMRNKLNFQLKLKDSEIIFLREKLDEANKENKLLEKRSLSLIDNLQLSKLSFNNFTIFLGQTIKSIRSFVRLLCREIKYSGWDLDVFNQTKRQSLFFNCFLELRYVMPADYLDRKSKSMFARFYRAKYLKLMHPKMERSLFGNLLDSGEYPKTHFFYTFTEMAKHIWLLHCLAFSFVPEASVFQVSKGCRFSDVYMESVNEEEAFLKMSNGSPDIERCVGFTVIPGFRVGKSIVQCQVYLC